MTDAVEFLGANPPAIHQYTVSFGSPVSNPRLHVGSLASTLTFGAAPIRLSGQADFVVDGSVVTGALHDHPAVPTDSNGTIELPGIFSSFTFTARALQVFSGAGDGISLQIGVVIPCTEAETPQQLTVEKSAPGTSVSWLSLGEGLTYDVVRGDLAILRSTGGNFTQALDGIDPSSDVCMANDTPALSTQDTRFDPLPGNGWFYLARCGTCTYNSGSFSQVADRDAEIAAAVNACP